MHITPFEIKILELYWLRRTDDPKDLCAHGHIYVRIADEVVTDKDDSCTLSSTALFLLRTLDRNYAPGDFHSQLVPCCGFIMYPAEDGQSVTIDGCPSGRDWHIEHTGNAVRHVTESGVEAVIDFADYRAHVLNFADTVQQFYKDSTPKTPEDEEDRKAYKAFWTEWEILRSKWR